MHEIDIDIDTFHPKGSIQPDMVKQIADFEIDLFECGYNTDFVLIEFPTHPKGPIEKEDVAAIAGFADKLYIQDFDNKQGNNEQSDLEGFPDAPTGLIRRFQLRRPEDQKSKSWIPWDELTGPLFMRVEMADECKRKIYQHHRYNKKTGESNLTSVDIQHIFASEYRSIIRSRGKFAEGSDFDLYDVYVCAEATVLEFQSERESYPILSELNQKVNEDLLQKFQSALKIIGEALSEPLKT